MKKIWSILSIILFSIPLLIFIVVVFIFTILFLEEPIYRVYRSFWDRDVVFIYPTDNHAEIKHAIRSHLKRGDDFYCKKFVRPYIFHMPEQSVESQSLRCSNMVNNLKVLEETYKDVEGGGCSAVLREESIEFKEENVFDQTFEFKLCDESGNKISYNNILYNYFSHITNPGYNPGSVSDKNFDCSVNGGRRLCEEYTEDNSQLVKYYLLLKDNKDI